jgi:hypothetical protein
MGRLREPPLLPFDFDRAFNYNFVNMLKVCTYPGKQKRKPVSLSLARSVRPGGANNASLHLLYTHRDGQH